MTEPISARLKTIFLVHAVFAGILGLLYLVVPERWGALVSWPPAEPFDHRIIGATFLAFGWASWLARKQTSWARVQVIVQMNVLWCTLATLLMVAGLVGGGLPALGWVYVVCVGAFALAFALSYLEHARA